MKVFALLFLFVPLLAAPLTAKWETVRHEGQDYVTVRSIKEFYAFDRMERKGKFLELENEPVKMRFTIDGQDTFINNVKFVFSFKVVKKGDRYLVSRIDLSKLLDPILRPRHIGGAGARDFKTVIVDPGHGGADSGGINRFGSEKEFTLAVSRILKGELEERGFKVVLTRDADEALPLARRVKLANRINHAIFISIHFGNARGDLEKGIKTYVLSPVGAAAHGEPLRAADEKARPGNRQDSANIALAAAVHSTTLLRTGRPDQGIRRARFGILTSVKHPAVLVEGGYLSHPLEAKLIDTPAYQQGLAKALTEGVLKYQKALGH